MIILSIFGSSYACEAGVMCHWKDDLRITHFTDNLGMVPRGGSEEQLPGFTGMADASVSPEEKGLVLWKGQCKSCHYIGDEAEALGLISLSSFLMNQVNDGLNEVKLTVIEVNQTLDNGHATLIRPKLNQDEVMVLSKELFKAQEEVLFMARTETDDIR